MPELTLVLTGPYAGRSIRLSHHDFIKGETTLKGGPEIDGAVRYLGRSYQAYPKGSEELKKAQAKNGVQHHTPAPAGPGNATGVSGSVDGQAGSVQEASSVQRSGHDTGSPPSGAEALVPGGSGHQDTGLLPEQVASIRRAVAALDPTVDAHWNEDGKPAIETMAQATGIPGMSRQMIEAVVPGVTRESASDI